MIDSTNRMSYMRECALILASAPPVFAAAVDGTLVSRLMSDTDFEKQYAAVLDRAYRQPSIYAQFLTDRYGKPPSANHYLTIRDMVADYLAQGEASEHAWQLDNISPPFITKQASIKGYRKYLHTCNRSAKRVEALQRFCHGVQARWLETPESLRDTPFKYPPGIFEQHFTMHQFIIYLIFQPDQAAIAEIFCSGLLQVWVENGGGFNAYPAGRSVESARRVSDVEWGLHEKHARLKSLLVENLRLQQQRAGEWRKALEWDDGAAEDEEAATKSVDQVEEDCMTNTFSPVDLQNPPTNLFKGRSVPYESLFSLNSRFDSHSILSTQYNTPTSPLHHGKMSSNPNPTNGTNGTTSSENAKYYHNSVELADLGRARFDQDVAAIGDRDVALMTHGPVLAPIGRAPRGMESAVHAWNTFQYTTDEVNEREELKGDLHGGQLHRENRAARDGQGGMGYMGQMMGRGGRGGGRGSAWGGRGGRGGRNAAREEVQDEGLCAGRKPDVEAPPMAKGMAEEMDKSMFWDGPIIAEEEED
ncbi:conserved hypothetical protein [Pyrenophora tritici-repentis Pt-1C-BFP]|uniref:Uncharacterized protein n=2 Tax=Pyrenophora tritici-repentis TaxID=45151 RepID=B2W3S2_PYRTR|nr:uncharacterized protein PTRG_05122 [Pyrenophora tritici-repentis Pt-1C-BFP]EDU48029.1 conserved hypothetical protein [Pyrenophora tritici-repentis Pt-1C-BFP]